MRSHFLLLVINAITRQVRQQQNAMLKQATIMYVHLKKYYYKGQVRSQHYEKYINETEQKKFNLTKKHTNGPEMLS